MSDIVLNNMPWSFFHISRPLFLLAKSTETKQITPHRNPKEKLHSKTEEIWNAQNKERKAVLLLLYHFPVNRNSKLERREHFP